jgi:hypothetical protein
LIKKVTGQDNDALYWAYKLEFGLMRAANTAAEERSY